MRSVLPLVNISLSTIQANSSHDELSFLCAASKPEWNIRFELGIIMSINLEPVWVFVCISPQILSAVLG